MLDCKTPKHLLKGTNRLCNHLVPCEEGLAVLFEARCNPFFCVAAALLEFERPPSIVRLTPRRFKPHFWAVTLEKNHRANMGRAGNLRRLSLHRVGNAASLRGRHQRRRCWRHGVLHPLAFCISGDLVRRFVIGGRDAEFVPKRSVPSHRDYCVYSHVFLFAWCFGSNCLAHRCSVFLLHVYSYKKNAG